MRTVKRLYFYVLTLIGAEALVWGVIILLQTLFASGIVGGASQLAGGLSAVLVGLPIFLFHWLMCQRDAQRDEEEHASRIRAIFLYVARMAFLIPVIYAAMALVNRWITIALGAPASSAGFGGSETISDNLVILVISLIAFYFFTRVLESDTRAALPESYLPETRRLYRYLWLGFGLLVVIIGVQSLIHYLLNIWTAISNPSPYMLATGLALLVVGTPLWFWTTKLIDDSLSSPLERQSLLRLGVLYLISLAGVMGVLVAGGNVLSGVLGVLFGRAQTLSGFLSESGGYISAGIPLGLVWAYYGRVLEREMATLPGQPRREAVRRLYRSILSALGVVVVFAGVFMLVELLVDLILSAVDMGSRWMAMSTALGAIGIGLPLWLAYWPGLQSEAAARSDTGDRARRSVLRRIYLYLAVFALVVGAMVAASSLFFSLLSKVFGEDSGDVLRTVLQRGGVLIEMAVFLVYHMRALRRDGRVEIQSLGNLHAAYPVLVLAEQDKSLADDIMHELGRQAPRLPVMVHSLSQGAPSDSLLSAKVIVLPAGLAVEPPELLRLWLSGSSAKRLVIPMPREDWLWLGMQQRDNKEWARETASAVRQLAEGEALRAGQPNSPLAIIGLFFGAIFGFGLLMSLFSLVLGSLAR